MLNFNDQHYKEIVFNFLGHQGVEQTILRRAFVPVLLQKLLNSNQRIKTFPLDNRFTTFISKISHAAWYILWTIKWLILFPFSRSTIICTAFFHDIASSKRDFEQIVQLSESQNHAIINYGIIKDFPTFMKLQVYCFPYYFFTLLHSKSNTRTEKDILRDIISIQNDHEISPISDFTKEIRSLEMFYRIISHQIAVLREKKAIIFYISDLDHLYTRYLLCAVHSSLTIPTILVDHAVNTYDQINGKIFSSHYFCWGEYHKNVFRRINPHVDCVTIGSNHGVFSLQKVHKKNKWIYFLPSFRHPLAFTTKRSIDRSMMYSKEIFRIYKMHCEDNSFFVKIHPVDKNLPMDLFPVRLIKEKLEIVLEGTELVFVEDSSIALDLLKYDIPIIYLANSEGEDLLHLSKCGVANMNSDIASLQNCIDTALKEVIDYDHRRKAYEYYYGPQNKNTHLLSSELSKFIQ